MAFIKVIALIATIAISTSTAQQVDSYRQIPSKYLEVPDSEYEAQGSNPPQLAFTLQIPRDEDPIPFNSYLLPSSDLKAPDQFGFPQGNYYEVPVPSQDLQVPSADAWNPDNDPALLYELPVEITKEIVPTNLHPKKYDKAVFEKVKPVSFKPKEEVVLVPIKVQDYISKQKQQDKTILNFAKLENQKLIQSEKVKKSTHKKPKTKKAQNVREEPAQAATDFSSNTHGHFDSSAISSHHHPASHSGERVEFQMHGYDGPKSFKWGYDTGKGHNRQFRYEESNKDGYIKGHYGYYDKHGKLQMVHYDSHPEDGFHAEGNFGQ